MLGQGAFSTVTVGRYKNQRVAIKNIREDLSSTSSSCIKNITQEELIMQCAADVNYLSAVSDFLQTVILFL